MFEQPNAVRKKRKIEKVETTKAKEMEQQKTMPLDHPKVYFFTKGLLVL